VQENFVGSSFVVHVGMAVASTVNLNAEEVVAYTRARKIVAEVKKTSCVECGIIGVIEKIPVTLAAVLDFGFPVFFASANR